MTDRDNTEHTVKGNEQGNEESTNKGNRHEIQGFVSMEDFIRQREAKRNSSMTNRQQNTGYTLHTLDVLFICAISAVLLVLILLMVR